MGPTELFGTLILIALFNVVPSLLVGHLASRWQRPRAGWTWAGILLGWPFVLVALLIAGVKHPTMPALRPHSWHDADDKRAA